MKSLLLVAFSAPALAQNSADYALTTTVLDHAGGAQISADYAQTSSLGIVQGPSSDTTPAIARAGFAAQIYEATALQLGPVPADMAEHGTLQLTAEALLDDGTTLHLITPDITWTIDTGPLTSISPDGLATTPNVHADGTARVLGSFGSLSGILFVNVRNTGDDDFGLYAGDGVSDSWQVAWFGENNPDGTASSDPDNDGQANAFEHLSGYSPLDAAEFLRVRLLSWDGMIARLELSKIVPGTVYESETSTDLVAWTQADKHVPAITSAPHVWELPASEAAMFFRVHLTKKP